MTVADEDISVIYENIREFMDSIVPEHDMQPLFTFSPTDQINDFNAYVERRMLEMDGAKSMSDAATWLKILFDYDDHDGVPRVQSIFQFIKPLEVKWPGYAKFEYEQFLGYPVLVIANVALIVLGLFDILNYVIGSLKGTNNFSKVFSAGWKTI